ncbi:het domain containing protein [Colletotrichum plurivorum]|uniref:Het domain containing protein n=1 Tax=Colletotrichum plurivorum TaxID=2175906 RepID=A0A8H6N8C4_9PEZI|nr:het domain containing protein [Colletotrichum plurivorum]
MVVAILREAYPELLFYFQAHRDLPSRSRVARIRINNTESVQLLEFKRLGSKKPHRDRFLATSDAVQFERGGCSGEVDPRTDVPDVTADKKDQEVEEYDTEDEDVVLSADGECYSDDTLPKDLSIALTGNRDRGRYRLAWYGHCWGGKEFFKLTQHNHELLRQSIPVLSLQRTFQDAMFITLELGTAYIWIDSLCIVQDSYDDLLYESRRMGDVYCYAECNIAATGYRDGTSGLFGERAALPILHPTLPLNCILFDESRREAEQVFHGFYTLADKYHREDLVECSVIGAADEAILNHYFYTDHKLDLVRTIRSLKASQKDRTYKFWTEFVGRYAGARITKPEDRFPAASGIARLLEEMLEDNYIAGFWEGDLVRSLLWLRTGEVHDISPTQFAPSWSWASMCGDITSLVWDWDYSNVQPIKGVRVQVLSEHPGFESDLKSPSAERSSVRGLAVRAPLRALPIDLARDVEDKVVTLSRHTRWHTYGAVHNVKGRSSEQAQAAGLCGNGNGNGPGLSHLTSETLTQWLY